MHTNIFVLHYQKDMVTAACLNSLIPQVKLLSGAELFVIDNGSPRRFVQVGPKIIRFEYNLFLIEAFNRAMQTHPADVYICVANDTIAHPGTIEKMVMALRNPEVGIVAAGTNDSGAGCLFVPGPGRWSSVEATHVDNTFWGFRRDLTKQIGWPDCAEHHHRACWASNQDYCYRARQAGFKVMAVRSAYVEHAHIGGQDAVAEQAGRDWLIHKWGEEKAREVWA
jgi:GT2 family glycosyltransferase